MKTEDLTHDTKHLFSTVPRFSWILYKQFTNMKNPNKRNNIALQSSDH